MKFLWKAAILLEFLFNVWSWDLEILRRQNEHTPNEENKTTVPFIVGCHMEKVGCMSDDAFVSVSGMIVEQIRSFFGLMAWSLKSTDFYVLLKLILTGKKLIIIEKCVRDAQETTLLCSAEWVEPWDWFMAGKRCIINLKILSCFSIYLLFLHIFLHYVRTVLRDEDLHPSLLLL